MRRTILLSVLACVVGIASHAQDDMYFTPSKSSTKTSKTSNGSTSSSASTGTLPASTIEYITDDNVVTPTDDVVYYSGSDRDVDEYNRRGGYYITEEYDTLGGDVISFSVGGYADTASIYTDELYQDVDDDDYAYSKRMSRYDDYWYDPWYYGSWAYDYYYYPYWYHRWGWYSPWYSYWYDPWYYGYWGWTVRGYWGYPHYYHYVGHGAHGRLYAYNGHRGTRNVAGVRNAGSGRGGSRAIAGRSATRGAGDRATVASSPSRSQRYNGSGVNSSRGSSYGGGNMSRSSVRSSGFSGGGRGGGFSGGGGRGGGGGSRGGGRR